MLRSICIVFLACLVFALRPQLAFAQVAVGTPTRAINTAGAGYCFTDDDPVGGDGAIGLSEINITSGTPAMTDATIPARNAITTGNRTITPSAIHTFNNWANITTRGDHEIDIAGFCIGSVSRTDVINAALDDNGNGNADRTVQQHRQKAASKTIISTMMVLPLSAARRPMIKSYPLAGKLQEILGP